MNLIFEKSKPGSNGFSLPQLDTPKYELSSKRASAPRLPEVSELELMRHYMALSKRVHAVESGFYPLGSCTMKYNPKLNEAMASLENFGGIHPLQPLSTAQGCVEAYALLNDTLSEVTGMDAMSLQPAAGAHGELTAMLMIRKYHLSRNDVKRNKIIVPDSSHGTNPASAAAAGFEVVTIPSNAAGLVDPDALRQVVGEDTAALMLTNPNTLGIFENGIAEVAATVHAAGGLLYYDGANLNAIMGWARPGDMGFDIVHLNLHKTFSTPHGGGGPGSGPIGCKERLIPFMPYTSIPYRKGVTSRSIPSMAGTDDQLGLSIGKVKAFHGNFAVSLKALCYALTLGRDGLKDASGMAVLNANYLFAKLAPLYGETFGYRMHEFVVSADELSKEHHIRALDIAKGMLDNGIHPPTIYFPLIVKEAMMFEPTETESKTTLDEASETMARIIASGIENAAVLHQAPICTPVGRVDEVLAAKSIKVKYSF